MSSSLGLPNYFPPTNDANIIDISDDTDEEAANNQPNVEFPVSPKVENSLNTVALLRKISTVDTQLAAMKHNSQYEVAYYPRQNEELEANSSHTFKYIAEIQAYVERLLP